MEEVQKLVPWPIIDVSTLEGKKCFVSPGLTFTFNTKKNGQAAYVADFSGCKISYIKNPSMFFDDVRRFVEAEKAKRELPSSVTVQLLSTIDRLEKELRVAKKTIRKLEEKCEALEYAPGGQKFKEAEASFERLKFEKDS